MENHRKVLGVDVGASGIKGGIVDTITGEMLTERLKIETPHPATPEAIASTFYDLIKLHQWNGLIGCGFPAIMKDGVARSAANIDPSCIGANFEELLSRKAGMPVLTLNDADAAGIAEMRFGVGKGKKGVVLMITIGSGLGSGLFLDGRLVPNTELGHLILNDMVAEHYASSNAKKREDLSYEKWGKRFNDYLEHVDRLFTPDLFILGGGISRKFDRFEAYLNPNLNVVPAELRNRAGTVGAAIYAKELYEEFQG